MVSVIKMPIYYGSGIYGVQKGPMVLEKRGADVIFKEYGCSCFDCEIEVPYMAEEDIYRDMEGVKYLSSVVTANERLSKAIYEKKKEGSFPLVIGGDHSLGLGSIAGISKAIEEELSVFWIDAHGDFNDDKTSPSGNIHGMPLAASCGIGIEPLTSIFYQGRKVLPENVFIIGARDIDPGEKILLEKAGVNVYTSKEIFTDGIEKVMKKALSKAKGKIHISFDIDVMDAELVPGTGTPVTGGISEEEAVTCIREIFKTRRVSSMDFVEFNPDLDIEGITEKRCLRLLKEIASLIDQYC